MPVPDLDLPLAHGRRLRIRPARAGDEAALVELYERLSAEDRWRRFFSPFHPDERFTRRLVDAEARGALSLVAEELDADRSSPHLPSPGPSIVAEAGFEPLPNGDAEVALVVDRGWRGWLGPYLLDRLAGEAGRRGIANLEAEVLVDNRPMLAVLRARGFATVDTGDVRVVRALIGTGGRPPRWPGHHERPRVLVESPGGRYRATPALAAAGFDVVGCPGPPTSDPQRCPLLAGEACPLVDEADAVVVALPGDRADARRLLAAHRDRAAAAPTGPLLVVLGDEATAAGDDDGPAGAPGEVDLARHLPAAELVAVVQAVLGGAEPPVSTAVGLPHR